MASEWAELCGDEALTAAILERLLHDAEALTINGPSWRLKGRLELLPERAEQPSERPDSRDRRVAPPRRSRSDRLSAARFGSDPAEIGSIGRN